MGCKLTRAAAALLLLGLAGCGSVSSPLPSLGLVPDFTLTDQTNHEFRSADALKRKVWIGDFIYTNCPGPCPMMTSMLRKVQDQIGNEPDLRLVSFTVDPARDTPAVLDTYAKQFKAREGFWFFLTGTQDALNQLARHAFKLGDVDGTLEHSTRFVLVDKFGRLRGYYPTASSSVIPQLVADAKGLLKEKI
ncbi:MAG TPA: SCO family protein [Bryobacteraceae bacterium]